MNTHHSKNQHLTTPEQLKQQYPLDALLAQQIASQRQTVENILSGKDKRLLVIVGPCSIHDPAAVLEYAQRLHQLQAHVADELFLVMRAYIEKPRTTVGWKGFLYDPDLNDQANLQKGLAQSRQLYLQLIQLGLPLASEILNPMVTGYFDDLLAWGAIGARTSESQIHREISSGLAFPVGFKNGTDGSVQIALDAIQSAKNVHQFFGMSPSGLPAALCSQGNPHPHLILRGSNTGVNYDASSIEMIKQKHLHCPALIVDCSHGNSQKNPLQQQAVLGQIVAELAQTQVKGVMIESHLVDGQQKITSNMTYGQSVTDGCLGWEKTERLLRQAAQLLQQHKQLALTA
ncbi:3-deoxy-7-phosphoheptulonate synthase [Acinetobacter sp. MD2(2019)]|uniref:3-deoxy-7-phosphoheptulonate synthase n=1 Tax=Acinetobacter sp. MD2(2019) TaxID=2605273 RepID=UPI002D1F4307|nr:3-deoxy-7-phosphoheptulonate synthase [Acinetobacter sp. MD2(2019)]MEB3754176.1 3-deoxy-7-phosphoheptulonate synthase [Acinetobacter sp. MD2(2019)]